MPTLYVKNMVCNRCIMVVKSELEKSGLQPSTIKLGEVQLEEAPTDEQIQHFTQAIEALGFEMIDDKKKRIIEQIKNSIITLVHQQDNESKLNLSEILRIQLDHDYNYLSNLFAEEENTTIEKYYIAQKIERVKELLAYNELSLTEIANQLNYSSVAYLSNQFKKVTGYSPSQFKQIPIEKRKPLDQV